ncbi:MAG: hypothetical protein IT431_11560 [Phycisphaerales bacterium]|nr:hypothetical protein [Phycisphaerales bacterium]
MTEPPIDTSISLSAFPDTIEAVRSRFVVGTNAAGEVYHPAYAAAHGAVSATYQRALAMSAAESALREQRHSDIASQRRLRAGVERSLGESRKAITGAMESIGAARAKAVSGIDAALQLEEHRNSLTHALRASQLQSALRNMGPTKALEALRLAIRDGRVEPVASALSIDALALGLTPNDLEGVRMDAERKFTPELVEERDALDQLRTLVARAGDSVEARFSGLVGRGEDGKLEAAIRAVEEVK